MKIWLRRTVQNILKVIRETLLAIASSVLTQVLYAAGLARFDLLKTVANLAIPLKHNKEHVRD
eukprot:2491797-Heterocapsa_arctica.AAC.1